MNKFLHENMLLFVLGIHLGVELLSHMVTLCLTFEELSNYFSGGCTISQSHQQYVRVSIFLHLCQLFIVFLIIAILVDVKWHLVVFTYISLVTNGIEHLPMCLLAIYVFLGEMYIQILCPLFEFFFFFSFWSFLYVLGTRLLSDT